MSSNTDVVVGTTYKTKKPSLYKVIFYNDDYTPFDFVVEILIKIFNYTENDAAKFAINVHSKGKGIAGLYSYEIAREKRDDSIKMARNDGHPLKVELEEADL